MATRENTMQGERMKIEAHEHDAKMFVQYGRAYEYMKLAFEEIMTPEGYAELKKKVAFVCGISFGLITVFTSARINRSTR